jgi:DNA-binding NarL/FixJ family response regulator
MGGARYEICASRKRSIAQFSKGMKKKDIASSLFVSEHTVSKHRKNICRKLDIHSTAKLIAFAAMHSVKVSVIDQAGNH